MWWYLSTCMGQKIMLIFVRHGKTKSNEPGQEKLRGWLPVPLDREGMKMARETAESLAEVEDVAHLYCATLVRVVQSAEEIAQVLQLPLEPYEELNDWDTGVLAGQKVSDALASLKDHIKHPEKKIEGGETFAFYKQRLIPRLKEFVESDEVCVMCGSGRTSTMLRALSVNEGGDRK